MFNKKDFQFDFYILNIIINKIDKKIIYLLTYKK
jgi:hypothetical protein